MNRNLTILAAGTAAATAILAGALVWRQFGTPGSTAPTILAPASLPSTDYTLIEAELTASPPSGVMRVVAANDSSGNMALAVPPESGKETGRTEYVAADLPGGEYRFWLRAFWQDGCGNSVGCAVGDRQLVFTDGIFGKWHWLTVPKPVRHGGGRLPFSLIGREDGIMVDQILLTRDPDLIPHGIMPLK